MLNEIYYLHKTLQKCDIKVPRSHTWIQPLTIGKGSPFFIVGIKENGEVGSVEYRSADKMKVLWQVKESNHSRFPAMNLDAPLWEVDITAYMESVLEVKDTTKRWEQIGKICKPANLAYKSKALKKLHKQTTGLPDTILRKLEQGGDNNPFIAMHHRLEKRNEQQNSEEKFICSVTQLIFQNVKNGIFDNGACELAEQLLLGKWNKNKELLKIGKINMVIDFDDYADIGGRITSDGNREQIIDYLLNTGTDSKNNGICALSGTRTQIESKKTPQPNLPKIGLTYLMSMNKDAPCHYRYRSISTDIIPVGSDTYQDMEDALLFITKNERQGLTWNSIPSTHSKKIDLLIVYLEDKPTSTIQLADMFSSASEQEQIENAYESTAKTVCDALKAEPALKTDSLLRLFVISKVDPGRKQIVVNSSFTVDSIFQGADEWKDGAKNIPAFSMPIRQKGKILPLSPNMPSPAAVMDLFKSQWNRNGHGRSDVHGVSLSEIYDVFILKSLRQEATTKKLLRLLLSRTTPLLIGLGGATRNRMEKGKQWHPFTEDARKQGLCTVALTGILLSKLNIRKENYMNDVPYNVGRMLALADTLHYQYCVFVREGYVPRQLIGNSLMATALSNPERALSMLADRLRIYLAWATTEKKSGNEAKDKAIGLAGWSLGQYGKVASLLESKDIPRKTTDADRAQILLGYLAREEKKNEN